MKHDPAHYIGIGKDGFVALDNSSPFDPDTGKDMSLVSNTNYDSKRLNPSPWFGVTIAATVAIFVTYLFLT